MKNNSPAVSVIIPIYMVEEYLPKCLNSAVGQTLKDIEIICVDDGTPDGSAEIAARYAEKHDCMRLIRQKNGGLSNARNTALDAARGRYVYFLDSDDYIEKTMLAELVERADEETLDIIYFNAVPFFENDKVRRDNQNYIDYYDRKGSYEGVRSGQSMFAAMRAKMEFRPSVCLQLFRRSIIEENHLRFFEGIIHEDNLFSFQCMIVAERVGYSPKAYFHRRVRGESIMTAAKSMKSVQGYLVSYAEMLAFMRGRQLEEGAFETVSDYLYTSVFGNARRIFATLEMTSAEAVLDKGDFCAQHFLDVIKQSTDTDSDRSYIKAENKRLHAQIAEVEREYRTSMAFRVGSVLTFLPRMAVLAIRGVKKRGVGYTLRVAKMKLGQRLGGNSPLVSVILPVYNVSEFIEECIDSLRRQTMQRIEIIAVDDGSTDDSLELLNRMAAEDKRIKVLTQQNKYAGAARNLGLSQAKGEYVIFLDSDDFFAKGLCEEAYNAAKLSKADVVLFGAKHYNNATGEYKEAKWLLGERFAPKKQPFSYKDCPDVLYRLTTPAPWTKMFRREFVQNAGLQFQGTQNANDLFFTYSSLAMAERIVTVDKPLVYYRVGLEHNLQTTKKKHPFCFCEAYGAWHDKLVELGVYDELFGSYANAALSGCLYNLRSQSDPGAKRAVFEKLKKETFAALGLADCGEEVFYMKENYAEMQSVLRGTFEAYMAQQGK